MNPKILIFSLVLLSILTGCKSDSKKSTDAKTEEVKEEAMPATEVAMNTLTQSEIDDGWEKQEIKKEVISFMIRNFKTSQYL